MAFHPAGMRQRGPQSPGALFTRPRESTRKFQEGHREASNLEQDALFLSPFLSCPSFPPSSGRGCHRRLEEKSKPLHWAESQKRPSVERWGCRADGEEHQAGLGQGWAAMWDRVEGRPKARGEPGLGRVLGGQHGHRPGQQAFLDTQNQSYLSSGFRPGSGMARVPRTDRGSWRWAFQEPGTLGLCLDKL